MQLLVSSEYFGMKVTAITDEESNQMMQIPN
jgi:hypothetical protein